MHRVAERGLVSEPGVRELGPVFKPWIGSIVRSLNVKRLSFLYRATDQDDLHQLSSSPAF